MYCTDASLVNREPDQIKVQPLYCRSWGCQVCAPKRRRELQALARSGQPNRFITLTVNPAVGENPAHRARLLAHAWRCVVARAKRYYKQQCIEYLAVFEATEQAEPHLHILVRSQWIGHAWLSTQMADLIQAPIVWIKAITNQRMAANYIAKYVGKDPQRFATCKRYWSTRRYRLDQEQDTGRRRRPREVWSMVPVSFPDYVATLLAERWILTHLNPSTFRRHGRAPPPT